MIIMIVQHSDGFYHNQIAKAIRELGEECTMFSWMKFDFGVIDLFDPERDVVFIRTGTVQAMRIAYRFERRGFHVLNDARYINLSAQKFISNIYARANGIPVPELCVAVDKKHPEIIRDYLRQYEVLVAKPIYSRDMGRHVHRITEQTIEGDMKLIETIPGTEIMLQNEIQFARLVRVIVLGKKMIVEATTYDTKHAPDWKATVCMNPKAKHYLDVPQKLVELAQWTNVAFGGEVAYIDFFEQVSGDYVLSEINHSCGLQHHEKITGVAIRRHIALYLVKRYHQLLPNVPVQRQKVA